MAKASTRTSSEQILNWVEQGASFFAEHYGLPPITGRILGWLLVCEPVEQSAGEIAMAIGASRASLTTNLQILSASGLVRRLTRPGGRTTYYRMDEDMWENIVKRRMQSMKSFSKLAADGLSLIGPQSARAARLRAAHEFFNRMAALLEKSSGSRAPGRQ
jgi:DNA-binding transcriptional regulator GbsR (MarR family)